MTTQPEVFNLLSFVNQNDFLIIHENCFGENQNDSQTEDLKSYAEVLFEKLNNLLEDLKGFIDERIHDDRQDHHIPLTLIRYSNYPRELLYSREEEILELIYKFLGKLQELRSFINEISLGVMLEYLHLLEEIRK